VKLTEEAVSEELLVLKDRKLWKEDKKGKERKCLGKVVERSDM
jgi:hypothetical protein